MSDCAICKSTEHISEKCPYLEKARMVLECKFCFQKGHLFNACPSLIDNAAAIDDFIKKANQPFGQLPDFVTVKSSNKLPVEWNLTFDIVPTAQPNQYEAFLIRGITEDKAIQNWSGIPGRPKRDPLVFHNSVNFTVTYGTAMFARCGGPGGYDIIPDHRSLCIRVVEVDSSDEKTTVFIDVVAKTSTVGTGETGEWVCGFIPI